MENSQKSVVRSDGEMDSAARKRGRAYQCLWCLHRDRKEYKAVKSRVEEHIMRDHLQRIEVPHFCSLCQFRCEEEDELRDHVRLYSRHALIAQQNGVDPTDKDCLRTNTNPYKMGDKDFVALSKEGFRRSFAYETIKDRLPVILAKIADTVYRSKTYVKDKYGEDAQEDLKAIAGCISKLRNEVQTSKPVIPVQDGRQDVKMWNDYLEDYTQKHGEAPTWFTSPWLYVECYMYRRIQESVEKRLISPVSSVKEPYGNNILKSTVLIGLILKAGSVENGAILKDFDVFREQKEKALKDSGEALLILFNYLLKVIEELQDECVKQKLDMEKLFEQFMQMSLWGNKCDLSISAGMENSQTSCPLDQVNTLKDKILIDDLCHIWKQLSEHFGGRVDIVLDNAGFELVTDLCLAEFLMSTNLASTIHFHGKAFPWFVSDVTQNDLDYTLQHLSASNSLSTNFLVDRWKKRLEDGSWVYKSHGFWTTMYDYSQMKFAAPELYRELGKSNLVIFKGDLNYRKLVGDLKWPTTTAFETSLRGFHPAPLCSLRTLKADVITGLQNGQAQTVEGVEVKWMISGNWAVMSYCGKCRGEMDDKW